MENNQLVEKWSELLEADAEGITPITKKETKSMMAQLLENQEKWLMENQNAAADLGIFTPILVPTVRRIFPALVANQVVGVQPMSAPTGYAFAWRASYAGTTDAVGKISNAVTGVHRGLTQDSIQGATAASVEVQYTKTGSTPYVPVVGDKLFIDDQGATQGASELIGLVKFFETVQGVSRLLVEYDLDGSVLDPAGNPTVRNPFTIGILFYEEGATIAVAENTATVIAKNEAGFNTILETYAGPVSTAVGEQLGTDMKSMRVHMERVTVEAETRKLKAEYTLEMAQDLKAVHNMDAEAELMNVLQYEIAAEIDRDLIAAINDNATQLADPWSYGKLGNLQTDTAGFADGQWEIEKLRTMYTRILKESNQIAITTRRGAGNFILCSVNVVSALEGLNNFMYSQVPNDVGPVGGVTRVGTLDGRFAVYVDTFNLGVDYCTVGYKGPGVMDTGVVYCPYIPIMMQKITHEDTFQPAIGVLTRSAICFNLFGTENYYRRFTVDFTKSQLA